MKKLRIYLDTSVISFLFADDVPELRRVTEHFFATYASRYELHVSGIVLAEIERVPDAAKRTAMRASLVRYLVGILDNAQHMEVERLATLYVAKAVVPTAKTADALHVAYAVVHGMDILLSWNFRHLANVRKEARFASVNMEQGYSRPPRLLSPLEVEHE